ncbi:MAG: hypothetical protein ACK4FJ_18595 [Ferrovibrio sp.]|uniref:phage nozzle protein n=1 Tax=Ferrovibrio sp. TaxID=1917215 RepID=UPI00391C1108
MLVSSSIPNLVNGVSQQPAALRLVTQCEEQVNGYSSVVEGLRKRPPTKHIALLIADPAPTNAFQHVINRDRNERYIVLITDGDLRVFDLEGVEKTVAFPDGKDYLTAANPKESFRCVTVADHTFVANTTIQTAMDDTDLTPTRPAEALVNVKAGNYGKTYKLTVKVGSSTYTVSKQTSNTDPLDIDTVKIATDLTTSLGSTLPSGFTATRYGNAIHIQGDQDFSISGEDGYNGNAMFVAKGVVQRFSDLPAFGPEGFVVEVAGDQTSSFDNYYVKFEKKDANDSSGVWRETVKPGIKFKLDESTMPHILVREADGTFTFKVAEWDGREVGDEEQAPEPSFVGAAIADIFFYRNRLGLLADESVVFSRAGEYFNYWPTTVTAVLDSDPVDVAVSHVKVSILRHAVPYNESLLLFSDQTQFRLKAGDLLTPKTAAINATTEFEASPRVKPVGAGTSVFFVVERGQFSSVREYFVDPDNDSNDASDITAHVPKYIPGNAFKIAASTNEDVVIVLSEDDPGGLYVYKYLWAQGDTGGAVQKLQSSWSRWTFGEDATLLNADFVQSELFLIVKRPGGIYLEKMSLEAGATDPMSTWQIALDRRITDEECGTITYDEESDTSTFTVPYDEAGTLQVVTRRDAFHPDAIPGVEIEVVTQGVGELTVRGDVRGTPFFVGLKYAMEYTFSQVFYREASPGGGTSSVSGGRLQLLYFTVTFDKSGYFRAEVTPVGRATRTYVFSPRVAGASETILGEPIIISDEFRWPIYSRSNQVVVKLINDSFLPSRFLSAEWEGQYTIRSKRV